MNKATLKKWEHFLTDEIWKITDNELSPVKQHIYSYIKIIYLSVYQFIKDRVSIRASALTYSSLLSIIPILAILFAIARGFGLDMLIEDQFRNSMDEQQAELIITWINSYLQHARSGVFLGIGLIMLLWTILILADNIERSFNAIWQVKHSRSVFRKITDYFSMILLLPLLIVISSGLSIFMMTYIKELEEFILLAPIIKFFIQLVPYALTWGMFICLFIFIPNTKVRLKYTVIPGIIAGSAFQFFQYIYINGQIWISTYNAIYGSFAAIPLFLLWTQISWSICLFGAELSYCNQNFENYNFARETKNISRRYHDFLCILIMSLICKRFEKGERPYTAESLAHKHNIPIRMTKQILYELVDLRLLYECNTDKDEPTFYTPSEDINHLNVATLMTRLDSAGNENFKIDKENKSDPYNEQG